jgi:ribose 1,5-bisphosphokinase PhnN
MSRATHDGLRLPTNLGDAPEVTPELRAEVERQAREAREELTARLARLERLSPDDLNIVVK